MSHYKKILNDRYLQHILLCVLLSTFLIVAVLSMAVFDYDSFSDAPKWLQVIALFVVVLTYTVGYLSLDYNLYILEKKRASMSNVKYILYKDLLMLTLGWGSIFIYSKYLRSKEFSTE